jgi:hypothetical protein
MREFYGVDRRVGKGLAAESGAGNAGFGWVRFARAQTSLEEQ